MSRLRDRLRRATAGVGTATYTGALAFLAGRLLAKDELPNPVAMMLIGALYALAVLGLVRIFGAKRWGLALAGCLCGPAPVALLAQSDSGGEDRAGMLLAGAFLGLVIGLMEWNRQSRAALPESS
ncbi:MAG: hypothetical protein IT453_11310 [Planctomycetes bacterium]|nr:hypothetical protein [Planctomycetota bacterium]